MNASSLPNEVPVNRPPHVRKPLRTTLVGKPLSFKELEILRWAVKGKTVWEISQIRAVSPATVKFHLSNIYGKLQVGNRVQAVAEAVKRGLCK
ncbi:LuxR family transcriptional regulator [Pseudomonas sp. CCM 7891]|uniref:LuxR family transcriptional regulator n=1 Tax=Pseudomonas karstica TaxID=1055468 RepID=A0A7X2RT45_9PSED|nr:helix-turn-helix transcriptional regulator [Pseudomonas karstica]MTD19540.1 LuxR family transcriptional regulator [Pseudomonas karstica]